MPSAAIVDRHNAAWCRPFLGGLPQRPERAGTSSAAKLHARSYDASMLVMPTTFAKALQVQLAEYKRRELLITEDGLWTQNSRPYPHILPAALSDMNLCAPLRQELLELIKERPSWKKHRDFHHLNSSQAMCWNVMMPALLLPGGFEHLRFAMGLPSSIRDMDFEVVPDAAEFTNFDSVIHLEDGGTAFVEAKLTEREFGTAVRNGQREAKRTEMYAPRLLGKVAPQLLEEAAFYAHYQLLRNLSHLNTPADRLVLLLPRASAGLVGQADSFISLVQPPWRAQVSLLSVEDLIQRMATRTEGTGRLHYDDCKRKYILR